MWGVCRWADKPLFYFVPLFGTLRMQEQKKVVVMITAEKQLR